MFKYLLLINVSALEGYVAQTRIQAQQSFRLCRWVATVGFLLILAGVGFAFYGTISDGPAKNLDAAYLAAIAGLISEFIASVFFYLYSRTLQQINRFHDKLVAMQQISMSFLATSLVGDQGKRDDTKIMIAKRLVVSVDVESQKPNGAEA